MKLNGLSASKVKTYKQCPFKFYMNYHLNIDLGTSFAAEQGSLVHIIFEKFGEARRDGIKDSYIESHWYEEMLYAYKEEEIWKLSKNALERKKECESCNYFLNGSCDIVGKSIESFDGCPKDEWEDAISLVGKIINDTTIKSPLNKKIIDIEQLFEFKIKHKDEEIPVIGLMDVVSELNKETLEISDYKSGKHIMSYNECLKDPQLLIYHLAARKKYSQYKNIFVTIYYLRKEPITLAFSEKDEINTENALIKYWELIKNNDTPKRRCDRPDGSVNFDFMCKYMCNPTICAIHYENFKNNGSKILPHNDKKVEKKVWLKRLSSDNKKQLKEVIDE